MAVFLVTGSMKKPPLNCSITGLERLNYIMRQQEIHDLLCLLGISKNEIYKGQMVFVRTEVTKVLSILTMLSFTIVSQSQDKKGEFITWTLVKSISKYQMQKYFKETLTTPTDKTIERHISLHQEIKSEN